AAVAGIVVGRDVQDVLAGLGELRVDGRLAAERAFARFLLFHFGIGLVERHGAWTAVLRPSQRDRRTRTRQRRARAAGVLHVVDRPHRDRERRAGGRRARGRETERRQRTLNRLAVRIELDRR